MVIELDDLIDEMEEVLAEARRVPLTGSLLVSEERLLDIIDRMRVAVPEELKHARRIVQEHDRLIDEARARVQQVLDEEGLRAAIEEERRYLLEQADIEAAQVRAGADEYAHQVLRELDEQLSGLLASVRNGLKTLSH